MKSGGIYSRLSLERQTLWSVFLWSKVRGFITDFFEERINKFLFYFFITSNHAVFNGLISAYNFQSKLTCFQCISTFRLIAFFKKGIGKCFLLVCISKLSRSFFLSFAAPNSRLYSACFSSFSGSENILLGILLIHIYPCDAIRYKS